MPAFFNGVFGHKPSGGLVPGTGQYPVAGGKALKYLTTGPLCRDVDDLPFLTNLMMGPDGKDSGCIEFEHLNNLEEKVKQVDISELTIYYLDSIDSFKLSNMDDELKESLYSAVNELSKTCKVVNIKELDKFKHLSNAVDIWSCMLHEGNPVTFRSLMANGDKGFSAIKEFIKWLIIGKTPFTLPGLGLCIVENAPAWFPKRSQEFIRQGEQLKIEFEELLGTNGVLLCPSHPKIAPKHSYPILTTFNWIYTGIWNVLLAPATQVPMGLSKDNLPLGLQVIAPNGQDALTLAVSNHLSSKFGGWIPPHTITK